MNKLEITNWLKTYKIKNYHINDDLSVDVDGNVDLSDNGLTSIPVNFRNVVGYFSCESNQLTSLENCPKLVGEDFYCDNNNLTSLEHSPHNVGGNFDCSYNNLTSLEHCPQVVGGGFYCHCNKLTSLEHHPNTVDSMFYLGNVSYPCSEDMSKWLISRNKDGINIIDNPSDDMLILHRVLWEI